MKNRSSSKHSWYRRLQRRSRRYLLWLGAIVVVLLLLRYLNLLGDYSPQYHEPKDLQRQSR